MSALSTLSQFVSPTDVRNALRTNSAYTVNRDRAAALAQKGLDAYDAYQSAKPFLFWGSIAGLLASGYMFEKRGRRTKNKEAMLLYGGVFTVCAATAWFTRPGGETVPADAPKGTPASGDGALIGWVDGTVKKLKASDPDFADRTFGRLVNMPGINTQFKKMDPLIQAVVV